VHCPWTTTRRLRVWVCWQSLQVEYTGSFLVLTGHAYLSVKIRIAKCFTNSVKRFRCEVMFEN
jgi:hypothetical protein